MSSEVETIAWAGPTPWHGLGTEVQDDLSPREMQIKAKLDWQVEKVPLHYDFDGITLDSDQFALVRSSDGSMLDIVRSNNWEPVQNDEVFEFFNCFVRENKMSMDVAGSLRDGQIVFALAKMNHRFYVGPGSDDRTEGYLLFTNPHKYGQAVDIRLTPIRVVCMNTLSLALSSESMAKVKYSHRHKFDVRAAQSVFDESLHLFNDYGSTARFLASRTYDDATLREYFAACFPYVSNMHTRRPRRDKLSGNAEHALSIVETQPGARYARSTWWNALNAVTYLTDHEVGRTTETRLHSAWYGKGDQRKRKALKLAVDYAQAA